MKQTWHELLFAHWRCDPRVLAPLVPAPLELDRFDGDAWVGVVPFRMSNVSPRGVPPVPGVSAFPELNVRTYVRAGGMPGVYFFSLDAASRLAVAAARALFGLPYFHASMRLEYAGDTVRYRSRRRVRAGSPPAELVASYRPVGAVAYARPGTLEWFLTARYCLHTVDHRARVHSVDIHHAPWPLQRAAAEFETNSMAAAVGIALPPEAPLLHFSQRLDVIVWAPRLLREPGPGAGGRS
jgi:uncharacterized protein YqjF (DUF2071 family)